MIILVPLMRRWLCLGRAAEWSLVFEALSAPRRTRGSVPQQASSSMSGWTGLFSAGLLVLGLCVMRAGWRCRSCVA